MSEDSPFTQCPTPNPHVGGSASSIARIGFERIDTERSQTTTLGIESRVISAFVNGNETRLLQYSGHCRVEWIKEWAVYDITNWGMYQRASAVSYSITQQGNSAANSVAKQESSSTQTSLSSNHQTTRSDKHPR